MKRSYRRWSIVTGSPELIFSGRVYNLLYLIRRAHCTRPGWWRGGDVNAASSALFYRHRRPITLALNHCFCTITSTTNTTQPYNYINSNTTTTDIHYVVIAEHLATTTTTTNTTLTTVTATTATTVYHHTCIIIYYRPYIIRHRVIGSNRADNNMDHR